jgi:polyhydroxyalkanoate synthase
MARRKQALVAEPVETQEPASRAKRPAVEKKRTTRRSEPRNAETPPVEAQEKRAQPQEPGAAEHSRPMFARTDEAVGGGEAASPPTLQEAFETLALLAKNGPAAEAAMKLAFETVKIGAGASDIEPKKNDWRFKDSAWSDNPLYKMMSQAYLAWSDTLTDMAENLELDDWRAKERARFMTSVLTSAFAPTNFLLGNPRAIEKAFETGGASLVRGFQNYLRDVFEQRSIPQQVDRSGFKVGENLGVTPGAVVFRNEICEVIQYKAPGATVRERPLLIVPPPIGKYYFLDLAPQRSFFEYALSRGIQLFTISWFNPGPEQASWSFDNYVGAILEAMDVLRDVTGSPDINVMGFCAGGILLATALSYLAAHNDDQVNAAAFAVMLLDFDVQAALGSLSASSILDVARAGSTEKGILEAKSLASVFAWMRPNDLVWNYWVNNYLMGEKPPVSDLMAWNDDGTNLPATLHGQFLDAFGGNKLVKTGEFSVLGTPVDLKRIRHDTYVMGAVADHLTPWQGCYRATQLFDSDSTFVLSNSGHIAGLVNPPGNPKSKYFVGPKPGDDPNQWLSQATERPGTWWEHWADWMTERSGAEKPAPKELGSPRHPAMDPAPGKYVFT